MADIAVYARLATSLVPVNREARLTVGGMKEGERGQFERKNPRNMAQHRAYFAMLNNVVEASGQWKSREDLEFDLAIALKAGDVFKDRSGNTHFRPWSRRVASMPRDDFERLHTDTVRLLTEWLGCSPEALREEAA